MCATFSQLQNLSEWDDGKQRRWREAVEHIKFVVAMRRRQVREGKWFLREHPAGASSWGLAQTQELQEEEGVLTVAGDQRAYGLKRS